MSTTAIAIAADHAGQPLKAELAHELARQGFDVVDLGTEGEASVDYPDFADALARRIEAGEVARGVLICGSGIGMSIAANRHREIRAALCRDVEGARLSRQHNDANVLVLGGRVTPLDQAKACLATFLETPFEGGRHARRVAKLA
ncbi:MAG: ribose 5-phosphate isomerase B [Alphaproteobacteria bacterium]|nr:ribose 5-phosphate isomerase B [Alphaproteobacteria bacterium]